MLDKKADPIRNSGAPASVSSEYVSAKSSVMANQRFFVTGTDTDVGKTFCACALLWAARQKGLVTGAVKPIAAGCDVTPLGLRNEDALNLKAAMTLPMDYETVNPIALLPPIAPHVAAKMAKKVITANDVVHLVELAFQQTGQFWLVEGAGGWRVPINLQESMADVAKALNLPVIMVVRMRLGCLNHALLTAEAIINDGLPLAGWIANCPDQMEMPYLEDNLTCLQQAIPAPLLGRVPRIETLDDSNPHEVAARCINLDAILNAHHG